MPRKALRVHLAGLRDLLRARDASSELIKMIPRDPRFCNTQFRLDPIVREFICCPMCHHLYPYSVADAPGNALGPIMLLCTHQKTPQSEVCNTPLWDQRQLGSNEMRYVPRRKYLHHVLKFWLGRLLSRKGIEDILDQFPHAHPRNPDTPVDDIWGSKVFHCLRDASGNPFFPPPPGEGRLVFSLAVDGFNPFYNKAAGLSASSTGIWLVLLNFPSHLRYLPENMFPAGVIPYKPSKSEINPYLELVVDDLLEFWDPGVFFSRTDRSKSGRLFRAMLIPLVADMLGARQVVGLPGTPKSHYFCTYCDLDYDDINVLDRKEWPSKDADHIRRVAKMWKDAASEQLQKQIFERYGLRWSPLLNLPYWNPVQYTIIESMHALDLGLIQTHCRKMFQIDLEVHGGDGSASKLPPVSDLRAPRNREFNNCLAVIIKNDKDMVHQLLAFSRRILYTICIDSDIRGEEHHLVVGTRWVLAQNIQRWVSLRVPLPFW